MKPTLVASLILIGSVGGLSAAEYTWNQAPGETWQNWGDAANWLVDGETATAAPGAEDIIIIPQVATGSTWNWDLGGGALSVNQLFKYDDINFKKYVDSYTFKNGVLAIAELRTPKLATITIDSGATLSLKYVEFGLPNQENEQTWGDVIIEDGATLSIDGGHFRPRHTKITVKPGATFFYGKNASLRNCNQSNQRWYLYNNGTTTFENGICKFYDSYSCPYQIQQLAGELILGGSFTIEHNISFQIELTGGKVSATGDVSFKNHAEASKGGYTKFTDGADLDIEVADGKTLDLTTFTYDGAATIRKLGAGTLKLADVPTSISMQGGPVTFAANTQTAMLSLAIGEGQSFIIVNKDTTIDELVAVDGSLTLAAAGLTVNAYTADAVAGTIEVTKTAFKVGDILLSSPSATLRAAVKAAAEAAEMNVDEDGETLTVGESSYIFNSTTVTDLSDATGWKNGTLPPEGVSVKIAGEGVKAIGTADNLVAFKSVTVANGAELSISGEVNLPSIVLESTASLTVPSGATAFLSDFSTLLDDTLDPATTLPKVVVESEATLKLAGGMNFKNVSLEFRGKIVKVDSEGAASTDGLGPIFGYADAGETSYVAILCDGASFDVHSSQNAENGRINFVNPISGGRVKVVGDIVMKNTKFAIRDWADFGNRYFGENNPTDEPFTVILDGTSMEAPWSFSAAGAARIRAINGSVIQKPLACAGHWLSNYIKDKAQIELIGTNSYFDYVGADGWMQVNSSEECDAMILRDGAVYLVGRASSGTGKGVFVSLNALVGVAKQWGDKARTDLLQGFGSARIESDSTMTICPLDWGIGNTDWERRAKFADIPLTGEGDLIVSNGAPTKVFTVTVVNGANTCSGEAEALPPVVAEGETAAETSLTFADGANWAGTVVANSYLSLTNLTDAASAATVTFGKVKLTSALPLRVWREEDGSIKNDTITLKDDFVVEDGDAGIVELVPQDGFEITSADEITLGTFPTGAFNGITVKCGKHTLVVKEYPTDTEGVVTCKAKLMKGFRLIIR